MRWLLSLLALFSAGCITQAAQAPDLLARGRVTADFASYHIQRAGLLPVRDDEMGVDGNDLSEAFHAELTRATHYAIVPLTAHDLLEIPGIEPLRRGAYSPDTLIELRKRFLLDAVFVASVSTRRVVPPQRLGVQLDLVSCESGATIWSGSVLVDASDATARESLTTWASRYTDLNGGGELVMLSPRRFARFAAWQLTQLL